MPDMTRLYINAMRQHPAQRKEINDIMQNIGVFCATMLKVLPVFLDMSTRNEATTEKYKVIGGHD